MSMTARMWGLLVLSLFVAGTAFSTEEVAIEVAQPILTEEGIRVSDVTFVRYLGSRSWGDVVWYTCDKSFVTNQAGEAVNRNAASLAGLSATAYSYHAQEQALFGDTVRVFIDLTKMDASKLGCNPDTLVAATLECVLINATRSMTAWEYKTERYVKAKHLTVEFRGTVNPIYSTRTYLFEALLRGMPRQRLFECEGE